MPFPVMAAMAAVSIVTTLMGAKAGARAQQRQANAALYQGYYNKKMAEYNGENIRQQSYGEAAKVFAAGERLRQQQVVAQADSGIVIGEGSAAAVTAQTENLAAEDALAILYSGIEGQIAVEQGGEMKLRESKNRASALRDGAKATMIQGWTSAAQQAGQAYYTHQSLKV